MFLIQRKKLKQNQFNNWNNYIWIPCFWKLLGQLHWLYLLIIVRILNNISIWKKKSGGRFFNQVEKNTIFNHLHASTGCTTKNKIITKNACVKSLEMYAITPVTYHVTFIFFISHVSNDIKTELAIRLPPCLGNSLL